MKPDKARAVKGGREHMLTGVLTVFLVRSPGRDSGPTDLYCVTVRHNRPKERISAFLVLSPRPLWPAEEAPFPLFAMRGKGGGMRVRTSLPVTILTRFILPWVTSSEIKEKDIERKELIIRHTIITSRGIK